MVSSGSLGRFHAASEALEAAGMGTLPGTIKLDESHQRHEMKLKAEFPACYILVKGPEIPSPEP